MNIQDWPIDKIMQLPDNMFGRRWPVGLSAVLSGVNPQFDISNTMIPDRMVIWDVTYGQRWYTAQSIEVCLATGEQLPTTDAMFNENQLCLPQVISITGRLGALDITYNGDSNLRNLRLPVVGSGRRLIARFLRTIGSSLSGQVVVTISGMPKEVPDCLISGKDKDRK